MTFKEKIKTGKFLITVEFGPEKGTETQPFIDIGKATGILFPEEQIPGERYRIGQRLKLYIMEVQKDSRGPNIILII